MNNEGRFLPVGMIKVSNWVVSQRYMVRLDRWVQTNLGADPYLVGARRALLQLSGDFAAV